MDKKICLVTVTSEAFVTGTLVMLHSFLSHNPWFGEMNGDIVIIHDDLPPGLMEWANLFERTTCLGVSKELKKKITDLCSGVPELKLHTRSTRFFSLDLFRLQGYQNVLFCDSDLLFLKSVSGLWDFKNTLETGPAPPLIAAGDLYTYTGAALDAVTFLPAPAGNGENTLTSTFNAGFMMVDGAYLTSDHHHQVMDLLSVDRWKNIKSPRTDQVVLNLYFRDNHRLLDARYNYLVLHDDKMSDHGKIPVSDIHVLHFNGRAKPWETLRVMEAVSSVPGLIPYAELWYKAYLDMLSRVHLLCRMKGKTISPGATGAPR